MLQTLFQKKPIQEEYVAPHPRRLVGTAAEFFAGIGLMRLGLERAGWQVVFANDIDTHKEEIYQGHFGQEDHFVRGDIHSLTPEEIPTVTLATASFPCTDLSLAGDRAGLAGARSGALWGFTDLLKSLGTRRPPLVLLENVTGFLTSQDGKDFHQALLRLNSLGYAVDAFIVDAARFVPQSRQRLFVAGRQGPATPASAPASELRPPALARFIEQHDDVCWSLRPLPALPAHGLSLGDILDDLPPDDPHWWSSERAQYLLNQMSPRHSATAAAMIAAPQWSYGTVFRRMRNGASMAELRTDGIAGCLRTPKGGSGRQILFKAGFGGFFVRLITAREAARLMGADDYAITVPLNQALFGFGDAVCVPVVTWIAENYLNPLAEEMLQCPAPAGCSRFGR